VEGKDRIGDILAQEKKLFLYHLCMSNVFIISSSTAYLAFTGFVIFWGGVSAAELSRLAELGL
jgi:hypothetical protein